MERFFRGSLILLLATGLSACSLFSSDEEEVRVPKPLQAIEEQAQLSKVWSQSIGAGVGERFEKLIPVISEGVVYIAGADGTVSAFERDSGKQIWSRKLEAVRVGGGVSLGSDQLLLGTLSGEVIALDKVDGKDLWRTRIGSEILSTPVSDGAYVAVRSIDDRLTVLNGANGELMWRQEALQPALTLRGSSEPVIVRDAVFAGFASGEAKAFRLENGVPLWSARVAIPKGSTELERMVDIKGTPLVGGSVLYMTSFQGNVAALDLYSGRTIWAKDISSYKSMAEGFGALYVTSEDSYVSSVDMRTGAANWRQENLEYRRLSAPAAFSSYVLVGDFEGYIHMLSQVDGSFVGRYKSGSSAISAQPVVDGDMVFVMNSSGELAALKQK
ncbi:outer membrane protein assembly factor BamB [Endozoicomonas sp. (ex Bugula neritina AB1)]|nr:outer membrane protein assembly factor BamB [Endozoicomonas sp. (ex Bugula neritina AB1)]